MKIGILSMQKIVNYGSFMQAYALRQLLLQCGATDVRFIDIRPGRQLKGYEYHDAKSYIRRLKELSCAFFKGELSSKLRDRSFYRELRKRFTQEYFPILQCAATTDANMSFDLIVIGSDEVFNCCQSTPWGFTTQLYGDIESADRLASYAASFGNTTMGDITENGLNDEITHSLKKLDYISVRDENSFTVVDELLGKKPLCHLDPVLVYDFPGIDMLNRVSEKDYIIIYSYGGRVWQKSEIEAVKKFASLHGKKLISIMCRYDWCDTYVMPDDPFAVLSYFRKADYVVTDTFHGSIFSIITQSNFCTIVRCGNRNKLGHLLNQLCQSHRIANGPDDIGAILSNAPQYAPTENIIRQEKQRTMEYLKLIMN